MEYTFTDLSKLEREDEVFSNFEDAFFRMLRAVKRHQRKTSAKEYKILETNFWIYGNDTLFDFYGAREHALELGLMGRYNNGKYFKKNIRKNKNNN